MSDEIEPGTLIVVDTHHPVERYLVGTVTRRSEELGYIVYDYDDQFRNPRWCYAAQVVTTFGGGENRSVGS